MTNAESRTDRTITGDSTPTVTQAHTPATGGGRIPDQIGPFKILSMIGQGGMGTVFEAEQDSPKRTVALKVIRTGLASAAALKRFALESQVLGRLQHPGIAQVYRAGTADMQDGKLPYFAMEFVHGVDVRKYVEQHHLNTRQRLEMLSRICDAAHHAHQKGVIHRDLKPGNIIVDQSGQPKILDFGVARAIDSDLQVTTIQTDVGQLIGTLQYMSPEQVAADPNELDTRSDVYALGVVAYQVLSGKMPYKIKSRMIHEAARIIREDEPTALSSTGRIFRGDIETIVSKALAKEKERRYQSAAGLAEDIRRYLDDEPILARPPSALYQIQKFAKRNKALTSGLAIALLVLVIGLVASTYQYLQAEAARKSEAAQRILAVAQRQLADVQRDRAVQAEAEIKARADELKMVADFQAGMLAQIDQTRAGKELTEDVVAKFTEALTKINLPEVDLIAQVESFKDQWLHVNATDAARELIDRVILQPAITTIDKRFNDQPLIDAQLRQTLAAQYRDLGLYNAALPLQTSALETRRRVLGNDHPETLNSLTEMSALLRAQGELAEAEPYYMEALKTRRRVLGDEHSDTVESINNMGVLLHAQGKLDEAEPYFREGLEKRRRILGDDHPSTLNSINNLGTLLNAQGKQAEAEPYYREVLERRRRVLGPEHPQTLSAISNLGFLLYAKGRLAESEPLCREAMRKRRHVQGEEHPNTLMSIAFMGALLYAQGNLDEAEPYFREALEKRRRILGDDHPRTLNSINSMGSLLRAKAKLTEAEPYFCEALEKRRRILGDDHPSTLNSINNLGALLRDQGKPAKAEPYFREALKKSRSVLGNYHPTTLYSIFWLSGIHVAHGNYKEALMLVAPVEKRAREILTDGNAPRLAGLLMNLGKAQAGLANDVGQFASAESNLVEAYGIFLESRGERHKDTRDCVRVIGDFYAKWNLAEPGKGYDAKAAEWRAKLQEFEDSESSTP